MLSKHIDSLLADMKAIADNMTYVEAWAFSNHLEKEAAKIKDGLKKKVVSQVREVGGADTKFGVVKFVSQSRVKFDEELAREYAEEHDILDMIRSDKVDLEKVKQLNEAGIISDEDFSMFVKEQKTEFVKLEKPNGGK